MNARDATTQQTRDTVCALTDHEARVIALIHARQGRAAAIPMSTVAERIGISTRVLQQIIQHLICGHRMRIGSATGSPHGYYWITDAEDLDRAKAQLRHRIIELASRLRALDDTALADVIGQLRLALETP